MRNDSRPVFEHSPASPLGGRSDRAGTRDRHDSRDAVADGRKPHIVHDKGDKGADDEARGEDDPVMPANDATLKTRI